MRIGTLSRSLMFFTTEFSGTMGYLLPMGMLPEGLMVLAEVRAATISSGDML